MANVFVFNVQIIVLVGLKSIGEKNSVTAFKKHLC
jgi:hypothetical protein